MPVGLDRFVIGNSQSGLGQLGGRIKSLRYWNTRLIDAQVQALALPVAGGAVSVGGLIYTAAGSLVVANGGLIAGYAPGGLPVTVDGALCVAYGGAPVVFVAGIPFDASGRVCLVAPVAPVVLHAFHTGFDLQAFA
jgi:hypothetical protein